MVGSMAVDTLRTAEDVVRSMLRSDELDLPMPGRGGTVRRWASLAGWGRSDLAAARLAEGHTDALAILDEAGLSPARDALYGVWAARPGGIGACQVVDDLGRRVLRGRSRFCSGSGMLDRALVVAQPSGLTTAPILVEVRLDQGGSRPDPMSWQADGMAGSDTADVELTDLAVERTVGGPGWYVERRGFAAGGGGVASVWWGGAAGVVCRAFELVADTAPDQHQLAHLGELHALLTASRALLRDTAEMIDAAPGSDHATAVATVRGAVERSCRETVDRVPRVLGPGLWSGDRHIATQLADLQMYVRQHHGERDSAALASALLRERV